MKKYIFGGIAVLAIAVAVGINVNLNSQKNSNLSALFLSNIEALASGETSCSGSNCCASSDPNKGECCACCSGSAICGGGSCGCS